MTTPFEEPTHTTIQTDMVHGGTAVNIVAARCTFDFDIRFLPVKIRWITSTNAAATSRNISSRKMKAVDPNTGFKWEFVPGCAALNTAEDDEVMELAKALSGQNSSTCVGFGTEAGHFQEAGMPTFICGPGCIDQAHKADEFLTLDQIVKCENSCGGWLIVCRHDHGGRFLDPLRGSDPRGTGSRAFHRIAEFPRPDHCIRPYRQERHAGLL